MVNNKVTSDLKWDGVVIKNKNGQEKLVKIDSGLKGKTSDESFKKGVFDVMTYTAFGPTLYSFFKVGDNAADSFSKVYREVINQGGTKSDAIKAGLKGALLGGAKQLGVAIVDTVLFGVATKALVGLIGPVGYLALGALAGAYKQIKDQLLNKGNIVEVEQNKLETKPSQA